VTAQAAIATFRALADPVRVEIIERVASGREVTATALAGSLPITRQGVARHLSTLEDAGLVKGERRGREIRYHVETAPMSDAAGWLERRATSWDRALQRLSDHLDRHTAQEAGDL
jgi:DNA-binding transcriptional ArsR family regulator